jgi:hypothetical protein
MSSKKSYFVEELEQRNSDISDISDRDKIVRFMRTIEISNMNDLFPSFPHNIIYFKTNISKIKILYTNQVERSQEPYLYIEFNDSKNITKIIAINELIGILQDNLLLPQQINPQEIINTVWYKDKPIPIFFTFKNISFHRYLNNVELKEEKEEEDFFRRYFFFQAENGKYINIFYTNYNKGIRIPIPSFFYNITTFNEENVLSSDFVNYDIVLDLINKNKKDINAHDLLNTLIFDKDDRKGYFSSFGIEFINILPPTIGGRKYKKCTSIKSRKYKNCTSRKREKRIRRITRRKTNKKLKSFY